MKQKNATETQKKRNITLKKTEVKQRQTQNIQVTKRNEWNLNTYEMTKKQTT